MRNKKRERERDREKYLDCDGNTSEKFHGFLRVCATLERGNVLIVNFLDLDTLDNVERREATTTQFDIIKRFVLLTVRDIYNDIAPQRFVWFLR